MGDKATCPICCSHTSGVLAAIVRGDACPHCGASGDLIHQVLELRHRHAESELRTEHERVLRELAEVRGERDVLRGKVDAARQMLKD